LAVIGQAGSKCELQDRALVFQLIGFPELLWIFEKRQSGSIRILKAHERTPAIGDAFAQYGLLNFKLLHPLFVCGDERRRARAHDAVDERYDIFFELLDFAGHLRASDIALCCARVPEIPKHLDRKLMQLRCGAQP
jgi:hypothetical protein